MVRKDLKGQKFGVLKVMEFSHKIRNSNYWKCKCDCGSIKIMRQDGLLKNKNLSCNITKFFMENDYYICENHYGDKFIIDKIDFGKVNKFNWFINSRGYIQSTDKKGLLLHRLILNPQNDKQIDHINHNKIDNRRDNLRICTNQENQFNVRKKTNTSSKFKGVYWNKKIKKWVAKIGFNYKRIYLGMFNSEVDAAIAYNIKANELFGKFAEINKI